MKSLEQKYISFESGKYHENCYENNILPKCDICNYPLKERYNIDSWGNQYHDKHKNKPGTCSSCSRIVSKKTSNGGFIHNDYRIICNICNSKTINSEIEIEESRKRVLNILKSKGFNNLPNNVPIKLVNRNQLHRLKGGDPNIKGLTDYKYSYLNNSSGEIVEETKTYIIYILDKLTKTDFDSVLAHEYLHVWLLNNDQEYNSSITEGFCNLGSFFIYNLKSDKYSEIQLKIMNQNPDPNYGVGYRAMKQCLDQKGWEVLIKEVKNGNAKLCY